MPRTLPTYSPIEGRITCAPLLRGIKWGFIGGLVGTLVMDLLLMGAFLAMKCPPFLCFSIVGDTVAQFLSILGIQLAGGVLLGIATHYVIGPMIGIIFGSIAVIIPALREGAPKRSVLMSILYVEILSQPMLATAPILLKMSASEILQWYGGAFGMHLIMGIVLGLVVAYGLQRIPPAVQRRVR